MDTQSIKSMLKSQLEDLGVAPGGVLLVHTSLKGLGGAAPDLVLQALLELLTPAGTLLVPALSYRTVTAEQPFFHLQHTPACIGALPERFRTAWAEYRSLHPTHSVCAAGKLARELTASHQADNTPVGPHSPFRLLPEVSGQILMLGCGLRPNTFMHGVEEAAGASYPLAAEPVAYTLTDGDRRTVKEYYPHSFGERIQRYDRLEGLLEAPALRKGPALSGTAFLLDAKAVLQAGIAQIRAQDLYFVD